ncbi:Mur ligase domain-containing protein, partial [Helicobacter trogontum]
MDFYKLRVHFIGIGGIGVSGLARFLKAQGAIISGSDIMDTSITQALRNEGININIPHNKEVIADKDLIIHSAIIKDSNIEVIESKRLHKQLLSRKEALKILLSKKKVLSICAAHGKSSTSAILAAILPHSGAIIGAISKEFQSNVRVSKDELLVFEADESDKSFLNSNPYKSIVINAEAEHLESYDNDFMKLQDAYLAFMQQSKHVILNMQCQVLQHLYARLKNANFNEVGEITCLYPDNDIRNITYELKDLLPYTTFNLKDLGDFSVYGIGYHNAINASIAILSAIDLLPL